MGTVAQLKKFPLGPANHNVGSHGPSGYSTRTGRFPRHDRQDTGNLLACWRALIFQAQCLCLVRDCFVGFHTRSAETCSANSSFRTKCYTVHGIDSF